MTGRQRTVLVTGAAGRLGRRVAAQLHEHGYDVLATDVRTGADVPWRFVRADLLDHAAVGRLVEQADSVVHLGNHPGIGDWPPQRVLSENLTMNANVFQAAAEHGVDRIVFAGTIQLIGSHLDARTVMTPPRTPNLPLDGETTPDPSNLYALSKSMSEVMLRYFADRCGIEVTVLRFPLLHDGDERVLVRRDEETPIDVFEVFTGLTYDDAARAVVAVLDTDGSGYRVYLAAVPHRHRDLDEAGLIERFYPHAPSSTPPLIDVSALTRDTGWTPSNDYDEPNEET